MVIYIRIYICMHVYMYVYMHACMHAYIRTYIIVDRTNWFGNLTVSLLYVFVLYFFCSLALTMHKTHKVLKCN